MCKYLLMVLVMIVALGGCATVKPWNMRIGKQNCEQAKEEQICAIDVIFKDAECTVVGGVPIGIDKNTNESHNGLVTSCPMSKPTK